MATLWCNGEWVGEEKLPAGAADRGLTLGLGLFETLLAIDGRPIFAERHLERLRISCGKWGWSFPDAEFPAVMEELLEKLGLVKGRARIRLTITAGGGSPADLTSGGDRLVWLNAAPCEEPPADIAVMVSPWLRNERSAIAGLKCASYAESVVALDHARRLGFQETLFFNRSGHLCEAAMANVFIVRGGTLLTPPLASGCLPGITRQVILETTGAKEAEISPADVDVAEEIFLTSATRGPVRASRIGDRILSPGRFTAAATGRWREAVAAS